MLKLLQKLSLLYFKFKINHFQAAVRNNGVLCAGLIWCFHVFSCSIVPRQKKTTMKRTMLNHSGLNTDPSRLNMMKKLLFCSHFANMQILKIVRCHLGIHDEIPV